MTPSPPKVNMISNTHSPIFVDLIQQIMTASRTNEAVCLVGEIGTGKRQAALTIHKASHHLSGRFITLNCLGLTDESFALDLFGRMNEGGELVRKGAANLAQDGTLYIHEVTELSKKAQAMLVRFLETDAYRPVGGISNFKSNVRIICSSSMSLETVVEAGILRNDLFHLLTPIVIHLPRLNDRLEDIPFLFRSALGELSHQHDRPIEDGAFELLKNHSFNGNLVELRNIATRILSTIPEGPITAVAMQNALRGTRYADTNAHDLQKQPTLITQEFQQLGAALDSSQAKVAIVAGPSAPQKSKIKSTGSHTEFENLNVPKRMSEFTKHEIELTDKIPDAQPSAPQPSAPFSLREQEASYLRQLLAEYDNNKQKVADVAGLTLRTLYRRLKDLNIDY
jgi:DNA-binding NtrC family response regulator